MKKNTNNKHAKLKGETFQAAMAYKQVAIDFFTQYLPQSILQVIDFDTLRLCPETYIDEDMALKAADVVYAVNLENLPSYLYVVCEHQNTPDKWMAFRITKSIVAIMDEHIKQNPQAEGLPFVYPIVFYCGQEAYNCSTDLKDLILAPNELIEMTPLGSFLENYSSDKK